MSGILRPTTDSPVVGSSFLGFQEASILSVTDRTANFDWADVYIDVPLATANSNYSTTLRIKGSFKRNQDYSVIANSKLVKDIYALFDAIGYTGGIDKDGNFCDNTGKRINIEEELSTFASNKEASDKDHHYNLYVYVYKEWNQKRKKGYTVVQNYVQPNTADGRAKVEERIDYLRSNGYLREATEEQLNISKNGTPKQMTTENALDDISDENMPWLQ